MELTSELLDELTDELEVLDEEVREILFQAWCRAITNRDSAAFHRLTIVGLHFDCYEPDEY